MDIISKYYEKFRSLNPKNTEIKLLVIILMIGLFLFRGIHEFEFSWELVISLAVLVFSMTCHEVAHGYAAYKFGDDTAKREGRITSNPNVSKDLMLSFIKSFETFGFDRNDTSDYAAVKWLRLFNRLGKTGTCEFFKIKT